MKFFNAIAPLALAGSAAALPGWADWAKSSDPPAPETTSVDSQPPHRGWESGSPPSPSSPSDTPPSGGHPSGGPPGGWSASTTECDTVTSTIYVGGGGGGGHGGKGEATTTVTVDGPTTTVYIGGGGHGGKGEATTTVTVEGPTTTIYVGGGNGGHGGKGPETVTETVTETITAEAEQCTHVGGRPGGPGGPGGNGGNGGHGGNGGNGGSDSDSCLSQSDADDVVTKFVSILAHADMAKANATAQALIADGFEEKSDSINILAGHPLGGVTFEGKADYINGVLYSPPITGVTTHFSAAVDCNKVVWYWTMTGVGNRKVPVMGFNLFELNDDKEVEKMFVEFNSVAWGTDVGFTFHDRDGKTPLPNPKA